MGISSFRAFESFRELTHFSRSHASKKLTPSFSYGCRRPIFSTNYYQVIQQPNAHLITDDIVGCTPHGLITRDKSGKETVHEPIDQIVCASGFSVNWLNRFNPITGRDGKKLEEVWDEKPEAYRSIMVHGFPNVGCARVAVWLNRS